MVFLVKSLYLKHRITLNSFFWRCLQVIGKQGIVFFIFALCAKLLTTYEFGVYNYTLNIVLLLVMLGDFGVSTAASKYVASYNLEDKDKLRSVLFNAGLMILCIGIIVILGVMVYAIFGRGEWRGQVLYLLPLVLLSPLTSLYDGVYRGLKKFKLLAILSLMTGAVSLIFVYLLVSKYGLYGALASQTIFYGLLLLVLSLGYRDWTLKFNKVVLKEVSKYSLMYGLAILGNYLFIRSGILILGHYKYIEEIAAYELLNKVSLALLLPFTLLGQVVAPMFSEFATKKQFATVYSKLKFYSFYFLLLGVLIGISFYYVTPVVIGKFLPKYLTETFFDILPYASIILAANVSATTIDSGILIPIGHADLMGKFYILLGVFGTALSLVLVYLLGYQGVLLSFAICSLLMVFVTRILLFRRLSLDV